MTPAEAAIQAEAVTFAKANKKRIAREATDLTQYPAEANPVSVFMAGSPGAGKTEASLELLGELKDGAKVLRIDPDDLRAHFGAYCGDNAWLFQGAVSIVVDKILDFAFAQRQSFLLDGTLSHYGRAKQNIDRSLGKGRKVQILYVYQDPLLAWEFVRAREKVEHRQIPPERFIEQYYEARNVVNGLKREYGAAISVDLLKKPNVGADRLYRAGIDAIDNHVPETYDRATLERRLVEG